MAYNRNITQYYFFLIDYRSEVLLVIFVMVGICKERSEVLLVIFVMVGLCKEWSEVLLVIFVMVGLCKERVIQMQMLFYEESYP